MRIGLLVTGDIAVRAAHTLTGSEHVDELVVIGPAKSKNFKVVQSADGCDYLLGAGARAVGLAKRHAVPLIWDGMTSQDGVAVWGANPTGLALAVASRETDPRLVAVAHPSIDVETAERSQRFPAPIGTTSVSDDLFDDKPVARATSKTFGAVLVESSQRRVTLIDDGSFMAGIALAAAIGCVASPGPVWESALPYLQTATAMGLVMAETT